ncbi:MAG: hypothetical protein ABR551_03335 [Gemmatimonadales bacterium]
MTVRTVPLASPEAGDPRMGGSVAERVAAVAALSEEGWRLAGRPLPVYSRATMPIRLATLADHPDSL